MDYLQPTPHINLPGSCAYDMDSDIVYNVINIIVIIIITVTIIVIDIAITVNFVSSIIIQAFVSENLH